MVFLPVAGSEAAALRAGADLGARAGCAATRSLLAALGADTSDEEADFAALSNAGVLAVVLDTDPHRLVLAADVADAQVRDGQAATGAVEVIGLAWAQVQSLFADEPDAAEAVAAARRAVGGLGLADALVTPAVEDLNHGFDLLWYSVAELDSVG